MRLSKWVTCGAVVAAAAVPFDAANAGNPGPMRLGSSAPAAAMSAANTTTYCQFNTGPRTGVTVNLRGIPFAVGVACGDGNGSYGVSVPRPGK